MLVLSDGSLLWRSNRRGPGILLGRERDLILRSSHHHRHHMSDIPEFVLHFINSVTEMIDCCAFWSSIFVKDLVIVGLRGGNAFLRAILDHLYWTKDNEVKDYACKCDVMGPLKQILNLSRFKSHQESDLDLKWVINSVSRDILLKGTFH